MSRWAVLAVCLAACSKSAGNQDKVASPPAAAAPDVIAVPQGGPGMARPAEPAAAAPSGAGQNRLNAEEGKIAIEVAPDAKAGAETVALVTVTPAKGYHVNVDFPVKLTLAPTEGVTLPKASFVAGGHDKAKGDATSFDEQQLVFAVKLTPAASGSYTINGDFKFAVCDRDTCLPKREPIAIAVAAK